MLSPDTLPPSRYEVIARIGRGGMAEALLAATRSNGVVKLAVLKSLWPELAEDPEFVEMFLDEARLSARLHHPNVVQTYEVVRHDGRLAIAMEYLHGQPLKSVLGRLGGARALGLPTRLRIVTSVLAALEYAHTLADFDGRALEVVHRDVSPHNVIVTYDGHVKLLDFGVAKTLAASHQTRPGGVKGKLTYLAPEAVRGDRVDKRADLFSVGVMLWEILAGRRLWDPANENGVAWRLSTGEPPPELPPDLAIPEGLREACARALALEPAARYQSAAGFAADLEAIGADASDTDTRRLGRLVSEAFESERAQRHALIEQHLRASAPSEVDAATEYASFEVSLLGRTAPHEPRGVDEPTSRAEGSRGIARRPAGWRGLARTLLVASVAAAIALLCGAYLGQSGRVWPLLARVSSRLETAAPASAPPAEAPRAVAPLTVIEPLPTLSVTRAEPAPAPSHERHFSEHARRRRALDLVSDDVLDMDGQPLAQPAGTPSGRALRD